MKATIENKEFKVKVLREQYALNEGSESFSEWVRLQAESDPDFFRWLTGWEDLEDFGTTIRGKDREELLSALE